MISLTRTQIQAIERRRKFHAAIAEKADALAAAKSADVQPQDQLPCAIPGTVGQFEEPGMPIELDDASAAPRLTWLPDYSTHPSMKAIVRTVATFYAVNVREIMSFRRTGHIVRPRQVAMYLCSQLTPYSLPTIGRHFGRDHTTVLYGRDKIARLMLLDADLCHDIALLFRLITGGDE
ncbi:helix-turn-helix domain-containing protein [Bradyrhizobium sp. HKCCYLS2038]|uniref:helix-turn-helix domain-containing protein n=1 Tax=unclassified Bradyrhizobium TaxID=2631580 RepID=UPI003EB6EC5E